MMPSVIRVQMLGKGFCGKIMYRHIWAWRCFGETGWKAAWIRPEGGGSLVYGIGILVLDTPLE